MGGTKPQEKVKYFSFSGRDPMTLYFNGPAKELLPCLAQYEEGIDDDVESPYYEHDDDEPDDEDFEEDDDDDSL